MVLVGVVDEPRRDALGLEHAVELEAVVHRAAKVSLAVGDQGGGAVAFGVGRRVPARDGLVDSHHMAGTVLAYANHRANEDFYAAPGEQDLTAHVNFTALRLWGQRHGLETLGLVTQTAFLLALGKGNDFADLYHDGMDDTTRLRARLQLKTLIFPEGMGERFQVLVQQKVVPCAHLTGLAPL